METDLRKLALILSDMFGQEVHFTETDDDDGTVMCSRAYFENDDMEFSVTVFYCPEALEVAKEFAAGMEKEVQFVDNVRFSRTHK